MAETPIPTVAGWSEFVESLKTLPDRMLAKLPEDRRGDPLIQQEIARLALESLASNTIAAIAADGDRPSFVPTLGQVLNIGQPNADTVYRAATITPGGAYRLRGRLGSLRMANMGEVGKGVRNYHDFTSLPVDADGRFDVLLSPEKPEGHEGTWWRLGPETGMLAMRLVSADWGHEIEPSFSIERVDIPTGSPRREADDLEERLRKLPGIVDRLALMFVDHVQQLRDEGYLNALKAFDISQAGGLTGQFYYEGAYELAEDEAMLLETPIPAGCTYYSVILTNEIYETIDWYNNHSSLNDTQTVVDADNVLRVVVAPRDPGVPNWLDTAGHARGAIQGRWFGAETQPIPSLRKVPQVEVRGILPPGTPAVTPAQRENIVRGRRAALQQRSLW